MLHLFVKYSNDIVKYYYNKNMFYITPVMFSLLRSSVSHDPPEINLTCRLAAQRNVFLLLFLLIIINNLYQNNKIFCGNHDYLQDFLMKINIL